MKKEKFYYDKALKDNSHSIGKNILKFIDIYMNRPFAALIVRAVFNTGITPNMITYLSGIIGLIAAFLFSRGDYTFFLLGGIFAQLSSIVDCADGMLARAKNMTSSYGAYLDLFFDRIVDFSLSIGIAVGAAKYYNDPDLLILGILAGGLFLLQINTLYLTKSYLQEKKTGETGEMRAAQMWGVLIFASLNRVDLLIYTALFTTSLVNIGHIIYFIYLNKRKDPSIRIGSDKSKKPETSKY